MKRINYRKLAFEQYSPVCAHCGFGIPDVLEVCHLDCQRSNNEVGKSGDSVPHVPACACVRTQTGHKLPDLDPISTELE